LLPLSAYLFFSSFFSVWVLVAPPPCLSFRLSPDGLPDDPDAPVVFIPHQSLYLMPFASLQAPDGSFPI
ncbi:MAG: hypothetical protein ACFB9N_11325, partial [Geitlerinemataceae cyanobacterium]